MSLKQPRVIMGVIVLAACISLVLSGFRLFDDYVRKVDGKEVEKVKQDERVSVIDCDLGVVPPDSTVDRSIEIWNSSKVMYTLKKVSSDCGCIINDVQPSSVAPGSCCKLTFRYRAPSVTGKIQRHIHLEFNEPESPIVIVGVGGLVRNWLESYPQEIEFQEILPGEVSQKEIQVSTLTPMVALDCDIKKDLSWLKVNYLSSSDVKYDRDQAKGTVLRYRLMFAPPIGCTAGRVKGKISFSSAEHELQVPYVGFIAAPFTIDCKSLFFGFTRHEEETKVQFIIRPHESARNYKLDDFSISHDLGRELSLSVQSGDQPGGFKVVGTFHPDNRSGPRNGVITVKSNDNNKVSIPASGWVK